jgi:hypothetical protein
MSARCYSAGGFWNYEPKIRSMAITSGTSPMAYVLTYYRDSSSCSG